MILAQYSDFLVISPFISSCDNVGSAALCWFGNVTSPFLSCHNGQLLPQPLRFPWSKVLGF